MAGFDEFQAIGAQARLHHAYLLGLQLMVSTRKGPEVMGDWMFRLFRRQHLEKFLGSFDKLGLSGLPHAVACARYHALSNSIGGGPTNAGIDFVEHVGADGLGGAQRQLHGQHDAGQLATGSHLAQWLGVLALVGAEQELGALEASGAELTLVQDNLESRLSEAELGQVVTDVAL